MPSSVTIIQRGFTGVIYRFAFISLNIFPQPNNFPFMLPKYLIIKYFSYLHIIDLDCSCDNTRVSAGWGSSYLGWAGRLSAEHWQISIISILSTLSTDDGSILHIPQNRGDWVKYGDKYFSSTRYIKILRVGWHPCLVWTIHQFKLGWKEHCNHCITTLHRETSQNPNPTQP